MSTDGGRIDVEVLRQNWQAVMVAGILAIIVGVIAIAVPAAASVGIAILIGILLIVAGVAWGVSALGGSGRLSLRLVGAALALLVVIAGIWLLARPAKATVTITAVLVVYFIVSGAMRLIAAIRDRDREGALLWGIGGALSILLGILIGVELPSSADWAIGLLVGIQFLFDGIAMVAMASAMKKAGGGGGGPMRPAVA